MEERERAMALQRGHPTPPSRSVSGVRTGRVALSRQEARMGRSCRLKLPLRPVVTLREQALCVKALAQVRTGGCFHAQPAGLVRGLRAVRDTVEAADQAGFSGFDCF